jgi:hypothetical protein
MFFLWKKIIKMMSNIIFFYKQALFFFLQCEAFKRIILLSVWLVP